MSNLDNLISKITSDCDEKANQIINTANDEASDIIRQSIEAAEKEKAAILNDAKSEAEKAAERIISGKKLQIRDENLNAKRETINRVFDFALQKLNQMSTEEYKKFLCGSLSSFDLTGGEIILPFAVKFYTITDMCLPTPSSKHFHNRRFYSRKDAKQINGGFILIQGGIEYNYTFETLLGYHRYELESEITKILF